MFSGNQGAFSFFTKKTKKPVDRPEATKEEEKKNLKRYPSIFRVKGFDKDNENYVKAIRFGGKGHITIETDVTDDFLSRSVDNGSLETTELTTLEYGHHGGAGGTQHFPSEEHNKLSVQTSGPYNGEIHVFVKPTEYAEIGDNIPLSIKMISRLGEHEVIVFVMIDKEAVQSKDPKKEPIEEPELSLPKLVRVVKESPNSEEYTWADCAMTAENVVKLRIDSEGAVEEILINMDSNLVKKLVNTKGVNIERTRNKYLTNVYSHALMVYTTMYGYFSRDDIDMDEHAVKEVQDTLNEAVEFSFKYYASFLMTYEDISD